MDLYALANRAIQIVNPNMTGTWRKSAGWVKTLDYKRQPVFTDTDNVLMNVQALTNEDIRHMDALNLQGVMRAVYVYAEILGVNRTGEEGGDLLLLPTHLDPNNALDTWLVTQVLEPWSGQWTKVAATLQLGAVVSVVGLSADLSGSGTLVADLIASGDIQLSVSMAGSGSFAADLSESYLLAASMAGSGSFAPTLSTGPYGLSVDMVGAGVLTATLTDTETYPLAVSMAGSGTMDAAISTGPYALAASMAGSGAFTGDLSTGPFALASNMSGAGSLEASLSTGAYALSASMAGSGSFAADLSTGPYALESSMSGTGAMSADLSTGPYALAASMAGSGSFTGDLSTGPFALASSMSGAGTMTADLTTAASEGLDFSDASNSQYAPLTSMGY